jgi:hypothetical protein
MANQSCLKYSVRLCLEVFVQTAIFIFVCIAVSGLFWAEWRLDDSETNPRICAIRGQLITSQFGQFWDSYRTAVDCEILRAFTLFRLVGNFDQSSIDFYLLISPEFNTSQVLLACCRLFRPSQRAYDEMVLRTASFIGNSLGWSYLPTFCQMLNLSKKWIKEAPWAWTCGPFLKWMLMSSSVLG